LEQTLCWSLWIRRVGNDDIKLILVIIQELESVSNMNLNLRMLITNGHSRKVLLGETDDSLRRLAGEIRNARYSYLINIAENSLFHTIMLDDFPQNTSITATNDQNLLWAWVREHSQMCNHFLVGKLISLGALNDIIKDEDGSIVGRLENQDILVLTLLVVKNILDFESHGLARPHVGDLAKPSICRKKMSARVRGKTLRNGLQSRII
jgi:hypothetical protein